MLYADNLTFTFGQYTETGIANVSTKTMSSRELNLDPVIIKKIIEHEGYRIGYLFYAQFISNYNSSLDSAFQYFLDEGISNVIVDLRYNPGGYTSAAQHLASSLAPLGVVNSSSALVTFQWNDKYQQYWQNNNVTSQLEVKFVNNVPVKMGLQKVYFLTGSGTASASELCITGLKPYMDVTTVGETTYGKYTASITLKPEDFYDNQSYYSDFDNWGIQPIVIRYANSQGVTDFKDGFIPDIPVDDDIWGGIPLGDKNDALIQKAIEDITGTPLAILKSAVKVPEHKIFDRGFSRFDSNKRELVFDTFKRNTN
jgi:C-terminal processing protease CtpA/Prc